MAPAAFTPHAPSISPEDSVMDAARLMSELDVGALAVCHGEQIVGSVTDRDITLRAAGRGRAPRSIAVAEVMRWHGEDDSRTVAPLPPAPGKASREKLDTTHGALG